MRKALKVLEIIHNTKNDSLLQTRLAEFGIARRELVKAKNRGLAKRNYVEGAHGNMLAEWRLAGWAKTLTPWFWLKRRRWLVLGLMIGVVVTGLIIMVERMS